MTNNLGINIVINPIDIPSPTIIKELLYPGMFGIFITRLLDISPGATT